MTSVQRKHRWLQDELYPNINCGENCNLENKQLPKLSSKAGKMSTYYLPNSKLLPRLYFLCVIKSVCVLLCISSVLAQDTVRPPQFLNHGGQQSETVISEGHTKILQCQAIGSPQPEYKWLKDGVFLTEEFTKPYFYKIDKVSLPDAGEYRCLARNPAGTIVSPAVTLAVAYFNDSGVAETESTVTVTSGHAAVLPLPPFECHPHPSVTWQSDDHTLLYGVKYATTQPGNQLVVLDAVQSDMKHYRAVVTNTQLGVEATTGAVSLIVGDGEGAETVPLSIVIPPKDLTVTLGANLATLQCIANARPLYQVETVWMKDGTPIEASGIAFSLVGLWNRTLTLLQINNNYAGNYSCHVGLRGGVAETIVASATLTVQEAPSLTSQLSLQSLAELGRTLTISCPVTGQPAPKVTWFRNAEELDFNPGSHYQMLRNGSLAIGTVSLSDSGMFQCRAVNPAGEVSAYTWLRVKTSAPILVEEHRNITVVEGAQAVIPCSADGAPHPNITWIHPKGSEIVSDVNFKVLPTGGLQIKRVSSDDKGQYTCIRANEAGEVTADGWVDTLEKTHIVTPPQDTRVVLGHVATLPCGVQHAAGVHAITTWNHNGLVVAGTSHTEGVSRITMLGDGSLQIQEARAADVGLYTCTVTSEGGDDSISARLEVMELPYPPANVRATKSQHVSKSVTLTWSAGFDGNSRILSYIGQKREVPVSGVSSPTEDFGLKWETFSRNLSADSSSSIVSDLRPSTGYQFRVAAVNHVGEGSFSEPSNVIVLPQEAPSGPPVGLVGSPRSSSELMIQWEAPLSDHRNGLVMGYVVRYRLGGYKDAQWYFRNITKETQHSYLINGLITWKDYEVQVAAYNAKGVGIYSDGIRLKTKEGVPSAPPKQVTVEALSSTVIEVTWKAPEPWMINGINQGYKVQAWKVDPSSYPDSTPAKSVTVPPSLQQNAREFANITGVEKYTEYWLTVLCFTAPGDGIRSMPLSITTMEDVPGPPSKVQFSDISDRSVLVKWAAPEQRNGILTGYTVRYEDQERPDSVFSVNLTADVTTYRITNLTASTAYNFSVFAWTIVGAGEAFVSRLLSGVEPVLPSAPSRLAVSNIQPHSVVLQFTPGFDGNASIDVWQVEALSSRSSSWDNVYNTSLPSASTLSVPNLVPFTTYQLRLVAHNVVGSSEPSEASPEFQTLMAPPAHPPSNVTTRAVSANELRVRWIPLQQWEWYGAAQGYRILYRPLNCRCSFKDSFVYDVTANSHQLEELQEYTRYEITMEAVNDIGASERSTVTLERTRESVPSQGPTNVSAVATSSTTIVVKWSSVDPLHQNGIILGYKVTYTAQNLSPESKILQGNSTFAATLTQLKKYHSYSVQVLAFTRLGDGALAPNPPVQVNTFDDVPGPPSSVSFPDVSFTYARIIWDVPKEPNGEITAYSITYHLADDTHNNLTVELGPNDRTFKGENLKPQSYYMFLLRARTRLGWGRVRRAPVYTTNNRNTPTPPSLPIISHSQLTSDSITFSWNPGMDGFAPIRYYTVQISEKGDAWVDIPEQVDYSVTSYTAHTLKPYTPYSFRLQATNDIGASGWSNTSEEVLTLPAAPSQPPQEVRVIPITTNSVRVEWMPVFPDVWSGDQLTAGYRIKFRQQLTDDHVAGPGVYSKQQTKQLEETNGKSLVLEELQRDSNYEIEVVSFNRQGESPPSTPVTVYVGEAVPTGHPLRLSAQAVSSNEIRITWEPPHESELNGELLGYKVFYRASTDPEGLDEVEVISADTSAHELLYLDTYVEYIITILCFNPAGDGPKSSPVRVRTYADIPGPVAGISFKDITMNSLKLIWERPLKANGEIIGYQVTYETATPDETFSKQVKQKVVGEMLHVTGLEEEVTYLFSVRAQTTGFGPKVSANVTTGPQKGSPARPRDVTLTRTVSSVTLHWRNSHHGSLPLRGYYIEARNTDSLKWEVLMKTESGEAEEYTVSYQNLLPSTRYVFRVIAYNNNGISHPAEAEEAMVTPSKLYLETGYLQQAPFYHQTWFMVTLAAVSIVLIIIVVATLCVKSKTYKYKRVVQNMLNVQEAQNKSLDDSLTGDETHFSTFELRPTSTLPMPAPHHTGTISKRSTMGRSTLNRSTLGTSRDVLLPAARNTGTLTSRRHHRNNNGAGPSGTSNGVMVTGRSPPRPAPASVTYSDDETLKDFNAAKDGSDSSEVTEKPTDISSTDSHESELSDVESEQQSEPASFVNHYANVNDTLRQSWKRQKPTQLRNYSSYTDSEAEGSAVMSLNGGQIIMNNMAGSRAPLPGFSSFV